jgi:hypothetical protein
MSFVIQLSLNGGYKDAKILYTIASNWDLDL